MLSAKVTLREDGSYCRFTLDLERSYNNVIEKQWYWKDGYKMSDGYGTIDHCYRVGRPNAKNFVVIVLEAVTRMFGEYDVEFDCACESLGYVEVHGTDIVYQFAQTTNGVRSVHRMIRDMRIENDRVVGWVNILGRTCKVHFDNNLIGLCRNAWRVTWFVDEVEL